jgi:Flp pilus assembly protein TadD
VQAAVLTGDGSTKILDDRPSITDAVEDLYAQVEPGAESLFKVDTSTLAHGEDIGKAAELSSLIRAGRHDKAIELLDQFSAAAWKNPNFDLVKAQIALMNDDLPQARDYARKSIKVAKDFIRGYKFLAYVYMRMDDWRRAKIILLQALKESPEDIEIFILASYAFNGDGESHEALRILEKAVEVAPDSSVAFEKLGVALFTEGQVDRAVKAYSRSIQLDKNNARSYVGLGTACVAKGWTQDALTAYSTALKREPGNAEALTNLGVLAFRSGQVSEGLELVYQGYLSKATSASAWHNLVLTLSQLFPILSEHFNDLTLDGISPLTEDMRHYQWALYLSQQPNSSEAAMRHMLRAAFLHQEHAEIANDLGAMLASHGWLKLSKAFFVRALYLHPAYVQAQKNLDQVMTQIAAIPAPKK